MIRKKDTLWFLAIGQKRQPSACLNKDKHTQRNFLLLVKSPHFQAEVTIKPCYLSPLENRKCSNQVKINIIASVGVVVATAVVTVGTCDFRHVLKWLFLDWKESWCYNTVHRSEICLNKWKVWAGARWYTLSFSHRNCMERLRSTIFFLPRFLNDKKCLYTAAVTL